MLTMLHHSHLRSSGIFSTKADHSAPAAPRSSALRRLEDPPSVTENDHCVSALCVVGTPKECASYACDKTTGLCRDRCESVNDCATGKVCNRAGECVAPPDQTTRLDDSGCALAPPGAQGRAPRRAIAFWLLALGALATRRRGGKSISP